MLRKSHLLVASLLLLPACGPGNRIAKGYPMVLETRPADVSENASQIFSYSHTLALTMDGGAVKPRYDRARESCLHDAALHCKLLTASIAQGRNASAHIDVALPHDKVAAFEARLERSVASDKDGVDVTARTTRAESVEGTANDIGKKVAQLTKYRDGLMALAKRPDLGVADYIKVQGELSRTEADLDEALAQKRGIDDRIARERLSVDLGGRYEAASPIAQAWSEAGDTLVGNTADALRFVIGAIPWTPVAAGVIFLVGWIWRIARRRPAIAKSKEASTGG